MLPLLREHEDDEEEEEDDADEEALDVTGGSSISSVGILDKSGAFFVSFRFLAIVGGAVGAGEMFHCREMLGGMPLGMPGGSIGGGISS